MKSESTPALGGTRYVDRHGIGARYAVSQRTVTNWMQRRVLPFIKVGRLVRFDVESCDRALATFEVKSS